jgi:hypothetical protein
MTRSAAIGWTGFMPSWTRVSSRVQRRIAEAAARFIEKDERIQVAIFAQDTPVRGQPLAFLSLLKQVGHLVIAATERNIYVFSRGLLANGTIRGVVRRYPIKSTPVELRRGWGKVTIGTDNYWVSGLASQGDSTDFVSFVQGVVAHSSQGDERPPTGTD